MRQWFHLFTTNLRWFVGTLLLAGLIIMFLWRLIDPTGFVVSMNKFLEDLWTLIHFVLILLIMFAGIAVMFGWRPFRGGNRRNGGHH